MHKKIWEKEVFETKESLISQITKIQSEASKDIEHKLNEFQEFKKQFQILFEPVIEIYKMKNLCFPEVSYETHKIIVNIDNSFKIEFDFDTTSSAKIIEIKEHRKDKTSKILGYLTLPASEEEIKEIIKKFLNEYADFISQKLKDSLLKHDEKARLQMLLQLGISME